MDIIARFEAQNDHRSQQLYWKNAGRKGYLNTYYAAKSVRDRITMRQRSNALDLAAEIGMPQSGRALDVGCGNGSFSNNMLAQKFGSVLGVDFSEAGIARVLEHANSSNATFKVLDLVLEDLAAPGKFDGVFLMGIVHHVKKRAPEMLKVLRTMANHIIVIEPNGAHLVRKALELTPEYVAAGEDSFRHSHLATMFRMAGFDIAVHRRFNIFPNNAPNWAFKMLRPIEPVIENTLILRRLCTVNAYGCVGTR